MYLRNCFLTIAIYIYKIYNNFDGSRFTRCLKTFIEYLR